MKKLLCTLLLAGTFLQGFIFAQVKSYVGVVRQQYYSEYVDTFKNMSKELKDEGYNTYSKAVDSYLEGGFGSGFVWVAQDGTNYIVTNRHVVANAETASVEFENDETGEITKYEGLKVIATDDDIDIAILAFKNGEKPFKKGLALSDKALTDGQEVWSAGFPGLGNEPIWQFGKGTVTNARARIKELLDPEVSTIIQHSAQVDSGNSGGPLLIASGKDYLVVGINTWKAAYRDSTNFAIPAAVINKMLERITSGQTTPADDRAFKLAKALGDSSQNYSSIVNFISYHKASVEGLKDFESVLRFAPTSVRSNISEIFSYNPAEGLRYACAYQMFKKYGSTEDKKYSYKTQINGQDENSTKITFTADEDESKTFETIWIKEHGLWRLDVNPVTEEKESTEKNKSKKKGGSSSAAIRYDGIDGLETIWIKAGYEHPLSNQGTSFGGEFVYFIDSNMIGISIGASKLDTGIENKFGFQMGGLFRFPVNLNMFTISPYAEAGTGGALAMDFKPMLHVFYEAGLSITFDTSLSFYPGLGIAYKGRKYFPFQESTFDGTMNSLLIYLSIGF